MGRQESHLALSLTDIAESDTACRIVLRHAEEGRLMLDQPGGRCFDRGREIVPHLRATVPMLLGAGLLEVIKRTYAGRGMSLRVVPTDAGIRRLAELTAQQLRDIRASRTRISPPLSKP